MQKPDKIIRTFQTVVKDNIDDENVAVFIDYRNKTAFGGHIRSWHVGDLLARYKGPIPNEYASVNTGVYHYSTNTFTKADGLPGAPLPQGGRKILTTEDCDDVFNHAYSTVKGHHQLVLNPKQILDFIELQTRSVGFGERTINLEPFEVVNARGHFASKIEMYEGQMVVGVSTPKGYLPLYIDSRSSLIDVDRLRVEEWVVVAPIGVVDGKRIVKVLRKYEPGVQVAIQHFKSGLLMPGSPRYSVLPGEDGNDIRIGDTTVLPLIEGQNKMELRSAPLISFQLDTFVRAMEPLSEYSRVELLYKDSHSSAIIIPMIEDGEPAIDIVLSPLSIYKSGKVLTI